MSDLTGALSTFGFDAPPVGERPLRLLMVEDDATDEALLRRALRTAMPAAQIQVVRHVESACRVLALGQADLALVDWRLPDGTGEDVVRHAASLDSSIPVVLMTKGDPAAACAAVRHGAQDFIGKDEVTPERLARCLMLAMQRLMAQESLIRSTRALASEALLEAERARQEATTADQRAALRMAGNIEGQLHHLATDLKATAQALPTQGGPDAALHRSRLAVLAHRAAVHRDRLRLFQGDVALQFRQTRLITLVDFAAREAGIPCHHSLPPGSTWVPRVRADPGWLRRAFVDLFSWVRTHGRAGEPRLVRGPPKADAPWVLELEDTDSVGVVVSWVGSPPDCAPARFEPFAESKTLGIDLSGAAGTLRAHGGGLRVRPHPDGGTLELWIPRVGAPAALFQPADHLVRLDTVVVTDDPSLATLVRATLSRKGHEVRVFEDGARAWGRVARGLRPDFVLADLRESAVGAGAFVRSIAAAGLVAPVVYVVDGTTSASQTLPWREANRILSTPFSSEDLSSVHDAILFERVPPGP